MSTSTCPTCSGKITENTCVTLRGALAYHVGCAPTSAAAPRTIWQAFLMLIGCH